MRSDCDVSFSCFPATTTAGVSQRTEHKGRSYWLIYRNLPCPSFVRLNTKINHRRLDLAPDSGVGTLKAVDSPIHNNNSNRPQ